MDDGRMHDIRELVKQVSNGEIVPLRKLRSALVQWAVMQSHGNVSSAARNLGTSRTTIYRYAGRIMRALR